MVIKRLMCLFLALTSFLSACTYNTDDHNDKIAEPVQYTHAVYRINISAMCISNDSVGNEWVFSCFMDGQKIMSGYQITLPINKEPITKTITATIEEEDKHPDIASQDITFEIKGGEEKSREITVTEDGGCYKGNEAVWKVTVSVEFVENIIVEAI